MSVDVFLDTNVLVYAATGTKIAEPKRAIALRVINSQNFGLSAQVLQEFFVAVTRKIPTPFSFGEASRWLDHFSIFPCQPVDHRLVRIAVEKSFRFKISYWDAAIVVAAESLGASIIYSEDLNDGQHYGSVRVINPFAKLLSH